MSSLFIGRHSRCDHICYSILATTKGGRRTWSFFVGLLPSAFTLTGYVMIPSMCEQVQSLELEVPKAIVYSVIAAGMTGIIYLIPLLFVMPNVNKLLSIQTGQPIAYISTQAGGFSLMCLIFGVQFFASFYSSAAFNVFTGAATSPWQTRLW
ncbi:unnamed protein product [Adineta ricciae]|uniref:Uncharacterized protein n=1 Tax=Adineta ricciae TaxID=249248 RepID=A0A815ECK6_ADIRI|nr:unnamed protein product [Adineta ricciae]CAF1309614.1 unnamed protein product [Adineta ricciae]